MTKLNPFHKPKGPSSPSPGINILVIDHSTSCGYHIIHSSHPEKRETLFLYLYLRGPTLVILELDRDGFG